MRSFGFIPLFYFVHAIPLPRLHGPTMVQPLNGIGHDPRSLITLC